MAELEKIRLANLSWDGDKDEDGFFIFLEDFHSLTSATKYGSLLEDMLDSKLRRVRSHRAVPSFLLDDPDFAPSSTGRAGVETHGSDTDSVGVHESSTREEQDVASPQPATSMAQSGRSGKSGHFSLGDHHTKYVDLPEEAKVLDGMLYNIFRMCIKGSKQAVLHCVTFPSYVQAVCVLTKHMSISRMRRISAAFERIDSLSYQGDTQKFQSDFLSAKRELDNCNANMNEYLMCKLMKSFEGKSKTIQFKIADDFNKLDSDEINFYDLVQGYCADLSSVGEGKPHRVAAVQCTNCKSDSHSVEDCPKRKARELNEANRKKNELIKEERAKKALARRDHSQLTCHECGKKGHIRPNCPELVGLAQELPTPTPASVSSNSSLASSSLSGTSSTQPTASPIAAPAPIQGLPSGVSGAHPVSMVTDTGPLGPDMLQQIVRQLRGASRTLMVPLCQSTTSDSYDSEMFYECLDCSDELWTEIDNAPMEEAASPKHMEALNAADASCIITRAVSQVVLKAFLRPPRPT